MKVEKININDIQIADYNPRIINNNELNKLRNSINTFGLVDPIIVNLKDNNTIIGGHQRYKILSEKNKELNIIKLGDIGWIFDDLNLKMKDINHEKALNIALNKISGEWDNEKLNILLEELELNIDEDNLLNDDNNIINEEVGYGIVLDFKTEQEQLNKYNFLIEKGYDCKLIKY